MAGNVYDMSTLLEVSRNVRVAPTFWLQFFPRVLTFDTPEIFFDKVDLDYRKIAPFVAPNVQGRPSKLDGYSSVSFKPAYIKMKDPVDPNMLIERQAGEALGTGSLNPGQRRDAVIAQLLRIHETKLQNRLEWMAVAALVDGAVTISGDDYPTQTVDFQRHASLTYTLAGAAKWDVGTGDPIANLKAARVNANNRSGAVIRRIVFGGTAWDLFMARVDIKALMDKNFGGMDVNIQRVADGFEGQEYMGTYGGVFDGARMDFWVDRSKYVDELGNEQFFLNQNTVVGLTDVEGVRCFGAIKDLKAGLVPMEKFQKMWEEPDPSAEFILTQSAPILVPKKPNASFKIVVA